MASSSSSVVPSKYEVFISFRGEDTRNNFVSHLHSELVRRGISTYYDSENLKHGQTLKEELPKAIEESSIAVVVLSTNFGSSTWCLRELVKIMDCKINHRLDVFPIFYNVDPSDVRKQKNSFFEAFSKHEENCKDDAEKVKSWRKALEEVADLVGEDIRGKDESSCIKNIADEISRQLPVKASEFRKSVLGVEPLISEIEESMYSEPNKVLFIGLWGMGGIGKTTTARTIFEDCKNEFQGSCFLQDVRQNNNKLVKLQKKLLSDVLNIKVEDIRDVVQGSSIIRQRLRFKKVLIVIDDVDDIEQLNALADQCDWFGRGSVIIITTRDVHLLRDDHVKKYDVRTLPEEESLHLFCLHAFKNDHPPKKYEDLSHQVLKYAGGLPLALKVLGDHLNEGDLSFWKSTLSRLKDDPDNKIISILKISFDGLSVLQQNIFLNIACAFRGRSKESVEKRLLILGLHPEEGIDVLIRKSLIFIDFREYLYSTGFKDPTDLLGYVIEMHDLVQEMGWYVVRQNANCDIRRYSHLWLKKDIVEVLPNTTVSFEVQTICMDPSYPDYLLEDNDVEPRLGWETAFRQMDKLTFFELPAYLFERKGHGLSGHYFRFELLFGQLSGQPYNPNLRWFSLFGYEGRSLPQGFRPMNLLHLHLRLNRIIKTPDFSHMPNLEELDLTCSRRLIHVHPSLGDHKKIKFVYLHNCFELVDFPKMKKMESLEILDLSKTKIKKFPEMYGNLDSFRRLDVTETNITGLPASIVGKVTALQELLVEWGDTSEKQILSGEKVKTGRYKLRMVNSAEVLELVELFDC